MYRLFASFSKNTIIYLHSLLTQNALELLWQQQFPVGDFYHVLVQHNNPADFDLVCTDRSPSLKQQASASSLLQSTAMVAWHTDPQMDIILAIFVV